MAENVVLGPASEIEAGPKGQEVEAGLGQLRSLLAGQTFDENHMHFMEITHVGRRVIELRFAETGCAPIARLLLLGDFLAEQLLDQILEPVPIGVGAHQLAGDLGAEYRRCDNPEIMLDCGEIETRKVKQLEPRRIAQNRLEIGRGVGTAGGETDKMLVALPVGNLDQAQPVARGDQPHRLSIDSNRAGRKHAGGEIVFVEVDSHMKGVLRRFRAAREDPRLGEHVEQRAMAESEAVPESWRPALDPVLASREARKLGGFLKAEEAAGKQIFPPRGSRLAALALTPLEQVKAVILGQDPYHGRGQAHGLCFSVAPGVKTPPSLVNIYKELASDLGISPPAHGNLEAWARQGVLLLNNALTVEAGRAGSHQNLGWEAITDAAVAAVAAKTEPCVFLLWGSHARAKAMRVPGLSNGHHLVLSAPHPSPFSAHTGFLGCRHFSQANAFLEANSRGAIDWRL